MLNHECPIKVADLGSIPHFQSTQKNIKKIMVGTYPQDISNITIVSHFQVDCNPADQLLSGMILQVLLHIYY